MQSSCKFNDCLWSSDVGRDRGGSGRNRGSCGVWHRCCCGDWKCRCRGTHGGGWCRCSRGRRALALATSPCSSYLNIEKHYRNNEQSDHYTGINVCPPSDPCFI